MAGMDEEDGVIYAPIDLLNSYPTGRPLHADRDVLVCVEPGAYPMDDALAPFGQAVALATGVDFVGVLPMDFPTPGASRASGTC